MHRALISDSGPPLSSAHLHENAASRPFSFVADEFAFCCMCGGVALIHRKTTIVIFKKIMDPFILLT